MEEIIQIFRMTELSAKTRAKIIIRLGEALNYKYASNMSEAVVYELVSILDPTNDILNDDHYKQYAGKGDE